MSTKKILFCFLLLPMLSSAQGKKYFSLVFSKDFPKHYHVIGGHFTGNGSIGNGIYLGAGASVLRFDNTPGFYFPVYGNFSFVKPKAGKKVFPLAFIQPGYGFYKHTANNETTTGGFTFHTSAGIGYPFLFHKNGFATLGMAHYTFKTEDLSHTRTSWGGRIGIFF